MSNKPICNHNTLRCYPQGECPLKDKCLWAGVDNAPEVAEQLAQSKTLKNDFDGACDDRNS